MCTHGLTVIITDIHKLTPTHGFIHTHIYTHSQSLILTFTISSHVPSHRLTLIHTQIYTSSHSQNCTHSHSLGHTLTFIDLPSLVHEYQFGLTHSHFHTLRHFRACFHTYAHSHSLSLLTPYTLIHILTQSSHCHSHTGPLTLSPHRREKELGPLLISREVSGIFQETPIPT